MQETNHDARPAPFSNSTEDATERSDRLRLYVADALPAEWEDEYVDLGGEG
jgi:hypothetical protein